MAIPEKLLAAPRHILGRVHLHNDNAVTRVATAFTALIPANYL
jgi:hypothetical protein